ncbi:MAG: acylglycerol kinase family protein, partial [Oscillospiraceae bacterium]|nr:acylglycerol kinase family protein [Oscillospiraceae bacterium]
MKTMLVINPHSGKGLSRQSLGAIVSQLCESDHIVTIYYANESDPETLAYEYAKYHDLAICAGGDGTLSSFISGILRTGKSIPVGYIPIGTANDIASTLSLSRDPSAAVKTIIGGS